MTFNRYMALCYLNRKTRKDICTSATPLNKAEVHFRFENSHCHTMSMSVKSSKRVRITKADQLSYGIAHRVPQTVNEEGEDTVSTASFGNFMSGIDLQK